MPLRDIFPGDGEMAALCRQHDWAASPLGPPAAWPISLRTVVGTALASRHPMILFWGPEHVQIYNDAYRPSLGDRHPSALGARGEHFWDDLWGLIGPQIQQVLSGGEATWYEDQPVPFRRGGRVDQTYWTYSYGPVRGDDGAIAGALVVCQETTAHVATRQERHAVEGRLRERERLLSVAGRAARLGGWAVDLAAGRCVWSAEVCDIHEVPHGTSPDVASALAYYAPESLPLITERFARCVEDGVPFDLELQIVTAHGRRVWVRSIGEAVRDGEGGPIVLVQGAFQDIDERKAFEEALRERDRRFREVAESLPLIVWTATPEGAIDFQTRAMHDYAGVTAEDLLGDSWVTTLHPDDREATAEAWSHSLATGEPYRIEFRIRRRDGAWRWHLTQAQPFRSRDGEILKWHGSSVDIHDLRELRRDAAALARRLTTTLESITDAFYLLDPEWRFTFVNHEAERVLERDRRELIGRLVWDEFPATVGSPLEASYRRAIADGTTESLRYFFPPLARWFDVRAYPSSEGLAVYFRDVTAECDAERRLREQAELLDRAQDAILVRDLDHRVVFWSAGAERLYGWTREEALGRGIEGLLYEAPEAFRAATAAVLARGEWTGELEHRRADGGSVTVEGRWSLVRDDAGAPHRILAINTDVSERKRLLAQFLRAQRMESIGTLAGGIAHDLNNVLAPILLSIGVLRLELADPELQEILTTIETSAERGADMIKQVLGFARGFERDDLHVDLPRLVDDLARVVRDTFPKDVTLRRVVPDSLWPIVGDPTQIHQVLMNLLVNARDAMPAGGHITVSADNVELDAHYAAMSADATPGSYVLITVSDVGVGMSKDVLGQIFDPFFTTKGVGEGTGLGLSTVAAIVRSHGGFVNVYSEVGGGTTFRLYLPADPLGVEARASSPPDVVRGTGQLVLVVDDEHAVREITRQTLEAFGYRVLTAVDGADGVATYARNEQDIAVVLTDMVMPIMDGPSLIRALKRMNPAVRIIGASGLGTNGLVARAADAGIAHFLPKPYTAASLLAALAAALRDS